MKKNFFNLNWVYYGSCNLTPDSSYSLGKAGKLGVEQGVQPAGGPISPWC